MAQETKFMRWFNERGANLPVTFVSARRRRIIIGSREHRGMLTITRPKPTGNWVVAWRVRLTDDATDKRNWIGGERTFTHNEIRCAFGLENEVRNSFSKDLDKQWCIKYRADVAVVGKFMRQGMKLNIPCNNTNFESWKAVSVQISYEMQALFRDLDEPRDAAVLGKRWKA